MFTVGKLISSLQQYPHEAEVCVAHQPHWPFSYQIFGVVSDAEIRTFIDDAWRINKPPRIWLVEGIMDAPIGDPIWRASVKKHAP